MIYSGGVTPPLPRKIKEGAFLTPSIILCRNKPRETFPIHIKTQFRVIVNTFLCFRVILFLEVTYMKYVYQRIRDLREDNDKTQADIAKVLNTYTTQYRRWETGESEIPTHKVIELCKYYKVSADYILGLKSHL